MKVGDKAPNYKEIYTLPGGKEVEVTPVCTYIHPKRRYFTLEYDAPGGKYKECIPISTRKGDS